MRKIKKALAVFLVAAFLVSSQLSAMSVIQASADDTSGVTLGNFVIYGGTAGVDFEYVTGTSPISIQGCGTNEGTNSTTATPKSGGVINVAMDVLKIKTSTPLTISTNGTSNAGIMIEAGVHADLTFDNVTINALIPVNIVTNKKEVTSHSSYLYNRPVLKDEDGDGVWDYLQDPTTLHLTLADGSVNTLTATLTSNTYQFPGIRCGEGSELTIDDGRKNVDKDGNFVAPENGRVSRDAVLLDGTVVHAGDRLTILDSENPGKLNVYGGYRASAIGGAALETSGKMTFNGGNFYIRAYDTESMYGAGAGIGGGHAGCGTVMTFNGGTYDVRGSFHGAGIGGGCTYGGGMSNSNITYILTDAYASEYPLSTIAGDININGGYIKSEGCTHSNAFGQACGGTNTGKTITITGGTLLPTSLAGWYDIGGAGGDVIVTGGSVRLSGANKFQSTLGTAYGDLEKTKPVFMTVIDLAGYNSPNMLVDNMKMTINGVASDYGMPSYTDEQGKLYFWLPNDGTAPEVRVDLDLSDSNGEKIDTEPFFITNATQGAVLKQYVVFKIDDSLITDENRLTKRYDGLSFSGAQQTAFLQAVVKDGIAVTVPSNGSLTNISLMTIQSQRLNVDLEPDDSEAITSGINANVGKYQLTITSNQYSSDTSFANSFWGHRCYYNYAEIIPADSKTLISVKKYTPDEDTVSLLSAIELSADEPIELTAVVAADDKEAATCEAPTGKVQFWVNGQKYGNPVSLTDAESVNASGHKQSTASIVWTPTENGGKYAVDGLQHVYAEYVNGDKDNYNRSQSDPSEIQIWPVEQGKEEIGGQPVTVTDTTDGSVIPSDNSRIEKIYDDDFKLTLDGGDTDEAPVFVSSNPDVATVDPDGTVHIVGVGEAVITATRPGNGAYQSKSQEVTVVAAKKKLTINPIDILNKYYDGETSAEIDPSSVSVGGITAEDAEKLAELLSGVAEFPSADAGSYSNVEAVFTLTGELAEKYYFEQPDGSKGDSLRMQGAADILSKPINPPSGDDNPPSGDDTPSAPQITVEQIPAHSWTGKEITPELTVKDGDKILVKDADYTVEFRNNINIGTADVKITGIGNYAGIIDTTFAIVELNIDLDGDGEPDINIDTDGDGEPDVNIDDDGDHIPDVNVDTDGDGEPDVNIDDDGDGKPDRNIVDKDGDGEPDKGIDNTDPEDPVLPDVNVDTDGDGEPDVNIDDDGDGKPDRNIVDKDGDGKPDKGIDNTDPENPVLPDVNVDTDGDGKPDINIDTDGDGKPDVNIEDQDRDGEPDKGVKPVPDTLPDVNVDTDGDGKPDVNIDTDGDGVPDLNIVDKDEDGKPDLDIKVPSDIKPDVNVDTDGDGKPDVNIDTDGDGKPDLNIVDKDGDGKPDGDIDPKDGVTPDVNIDTNGDGKPDINIDTDGDGLPDVNIDTDGDGKPDLNVDRNGDNIPDLNIDTNKDGKADINIDTDGDGKADLNIDVDGDLTADFNIDTDGDGIADKNLLGSQNTSDITESVYYLVALIFASAGICVLAAMKKKASENE